MQKQGLEFKLGQKVTGTESKGDRVTLKYEAVKDGAASEIEADIVLVSTGRRPFTGAPPPQQHAQAVTSDVTSSTAAAHEPLVLSRRPESLRCRHEQAEFCCAQVPHITEGSVLRCCCGFCARCWQHGTVASRKAAVSLPCAW